MANKGRMDYNITEERRAEYRKSSEASRIAKSKAMSGQGPKPIHPINTPRLDPNELMPQQISGRHLALSLFSGGGGLDLGFERAGFCHSASYDIIPICGETLASNRPKWEIHAGEEGGDVRKENWTRFKGQVDVMHGGPPCQPFSIAGQQGGENDERNMWGPYIDAIHAVKPRAFIAENVKGLLDAKFSDFVRTKIMDPLSDYHVISFTLKAAGFGVPQMRERVFIVGFRSKRDAMKFKIPEYTHYYDHLGKPRNGGATQSTLFSKSLRPCMGVREALGLSDIGYDILAPTIRSGFTGKRNTTSIVNSTASVHVWASIEVWPNGVAADRYSAHLFPAQNGHFRLSVQDCGILQGFPESWKFEGAVYKIIGQIGNSVAPPVAYQVALSVRKALDG